MKPNKTLAAALAAALSAGALSAVALAAPASAVTGNTSAISGITINTIGSTWYDSAEGVVKEPVNPGPNRTIELTTAPDGADLDFTITVSAGPSNGPISAAVAGTYKLSALVRLDGVAGTSGTLFQGPTGTVDVPATDPTFASGATITGTFPNVGIGNHTVTLTNLVLDSNGASSGGAVFATTKAQLAGFDSVYGTGTTTADIVTAPPNWLQSNEAFAGANLVSSSTQVAGVTNYIRPTTTTPAGVQTTTATFGGAGFGSNIASGGVTIALCNAAGASCDANLPNTLSTDAEGDLSGTATITEGSTAGARAFKISDGNETTLTPVTVLTLPTLTMTPSSAKAGTVVSFTGTNWNPNAFGVSFAAISNGANGICNVPDGPTPGAPCNDPVGNYISGPYVPGANNVVTGFTASATGTIAGSFVVTDPATLKGQVSQKNITSGASTNTAVNNTALNAVASLARDITWDVTAPTGSATIAPRAGGIGTTSTITFSNIVDANSAGVTKSVTWGDGTSSTVAAGVLQATHKYNKLGSFAVKATLKDPAGNTSAPITVGTVVIKDTIKPTATLTTPKKATKASSWTTVKGKVSDKGGAGAKSVTVQLVEKRKGGWYYYTGSKWKKTSSKAKAFQKAKKITDSSVTSGAWSIKAKKGTKGTLYVKYFATDKAGNKSSAKTKTQKIKS